MLSNEFSFFISDFQPIEFNSTNNIKNLINTMLAVKSLRTSFKLEGLNFKKYGTVEPLHSGLVGA